MNMPNIVRVDPLALATIAILVMASTAAAQQAPSFANPAPRTAIGQPPPSQGPRASQPPASGPPPSADELARAINDALNPVEASTRDVMIKVTTRDGESTEWRGRQVRKTVNAGRRILTVLSAPATVSGFAVLATDASPQNDTYWMYVPAVRRVRRLIYEGHYENFLGTDLSVGDLGFLRLDPKEMKVIGQLPRDGLDTWAVETTPAQQTGYSKIRTWVAAETRIPVRREFYDAAGNLWKTEVREKIETVDGVPVPLRTRIANVQEGGGTVLEYENVSFRVSPPDDLFEPAALAAALTKTTRVALAAQEMPAAGQPPPPAAAPGTGKTE